MAIIKIESLPEQMSLKTYTWKNIFGTNCWAFALGLDIHNEFIIENSIKFAYDLGCLYLLRYHLYSKKDFLDFNRLTNKEKIKLDCIAMDLSYKEIDLNQKIEKVNERKIAFFENKEDKNFHFYREVENGIWFHKPGWFTKPTCCCNDKLITNPIEAAKKEYPGYEYQNTICLNEKSLIRKNKKEGLK